MSIAVDRIRAEALAKIQDALLEMDAKMANLTQDDPEPHVSQPPETSARMERTALALDEIREHVRQAYGELAKVSGRLIHLWLEIRTKAIRTKKTAPRPMNVRVLKRLENEERSLWKV
ncbi:MAG TPA: hypothetical protein VE954_22075 [Oligoflexus sp.]|uniref:hypothetical protein n=1 Tax=Oligoflexus sp. TaxID=1971216 RepID=UPI002D3DD1FE|nr:hypothetical protein [Oligoflexus sp.]HYX35795.1 hypothetical protein [Oligoflexus sp.]